VTLIGGPRRGAASIAALAVAALLVSAGCGGNGRSPKAFCDSLRTGSDPMALFAADGGTADQVGLGVTRLQELERKAPSPISDALRQLAEVGTDIRAVLTDRSQSQPGSTPATLPAADTDKATRASTTVVEYASRLCSVSLEAPTTAPTTSAPTPPSS
jgi:hypothetical protein